MLSTERKNEFEVRGKKILLSYNTNRGGSRHSPDEIKKRRKSVSLAIYDSYYGKTLVHFYCWEDETDWKELLIDLLFDPHSYIKYSPSDPGWVEFDDGWTRSRWRIQVRETSS